MDELKCGRETEGKKRISEVKDKLKEFKELKEAWHSSAHCNPALERWKYQDLQFETSLKYIARVCLKKNPK
jgi:hypothetical protein